MTFPYIKLYFFFIMPLYTSYSEETQTLIEEFLENTWNWDEDELVDFIETYGEEKFKLHFEDYASVVDDLNINTVEAFLENFDISDVSSCRDAFQGVYESGAEFAQNLAEDCCEVPRGMSSWIEIDWKASWDNLDYDYTEGNGGHIFSQNF